jgi:hypothetical protein
MEDTAIQAGSPPLGPSITIPAPKPKSAPPVLQVLKTLASLRITVVLFVLSILLVFFGTLAQVDAGIWTVMNKYFRSAFVWVPFQIFFPRTMVISGGFPFPGGWLLGGLLLVNLLAAHAIRFKMTWKRSGIFLIHAGIIVMMLSELVTGLFAVESRMSIGNGETVAFLDHGREVELAIVDSSKPNVDVVAVIPEGLLRKKGAIHSELLPFDVNVEEYWTNSALQILRPGAPVTKDVVVATDGGSYTVAAASEEAGVGQGEDVPSVRIAFLSKDKGEKLAGGLYSLWYYENLPTKFMRQKRFQKQRITVDGKTYDVELRYKRIYPPFSIHLLEFKHEVFLGTKTPKNFSSRVELLDPERKEQRTVTISMNAPLRYAGETFYQSGFFPDDSGTILQVVRNPGWLMPYVSCIMVALGMIIHFGLHLIRFLQKRMAV